MLHLRSLAVPTLLAALMAVPVLAQQSPPATPPDESAPASPSTTAAPATPPTAAGTPPGVVATTNNPNLAVATVKLESGVRAGKLIGSAVRGEGDQEIGKIDDLIMTEGNKVTVAVVAVGGFLGLGSKLVAFPFDQLKVAGDRITLPGATKDSLNAMPNFQYQ